MLRQSFQGLWRGVAQMSVWTVAAVVAVAAVDLWRNFPALTPPLVPALGVFWPLVVQLPGVLVRAVATTPLCIIVQHLVLRPSPPGWRGVVRSFPIYLAWTMVFEGVASLVVRIDVLVPAGLGGSIAVMLGLPLAMLLALTAISVRLMLIFPAISLGIRMNFLARPAAAWRQMRGHFWLALGVSLVAELAVVIPLFLVSYLIRPDFMAPSYTDPGTILQSLVDGLRSVLDEAVGASVAACLYGAVVERGGSIDAERTAAHFT